MKSIAEILKQAREAKQLSMQDISTVANIPVTQYQKYETGEYHLLSASMTLVYKICNALDLDPIGLINHTSNALENYIPKAVVYAAFPKGFKEVSANALVQLAAETIENTRCTIVDVVIDNDSFLNCNRRENWVQLMQRCESEEVDLVIIPSINMLGYGLLETLQYLRYLKSQHDRFDACFLYENLYTGADSFEERLAIYCMIEDYNRSHKLRKAEFRKIYKSALSDK